MTITLEIGPSLSFVLLVLGLVWWAMRVWLSHGR